MSNPELTISQANGPEQAERRTADFPKDFFALQIKFAQKLSEAGKVPLGDALLYYTSLFRTFGAGRSLDRNNPEWQHFILFHGNPDLAERAYKFYLTGKEKLQAQMDREYVQFGCFSYDYNFFEKTIYIHFNNNDTDENSPLSDEKLGQRREDLKRMFENIKSDHADTKYVKGGSWLYNLPKYRRIFPEKYTTDLKPENNPYSNLNTWGQFLDKNRQLNKGAVSVFTDRLGKAANKEEILGSFPLQALAASCDISEFYRELDIK